MAREATNPIKNESANMLINSKVKNDNEFPNIEIHVPKPRMSKALSVRSRRTIAEG